MKKTLTINLSGAIFHIDEDAFHLLGQYLESLRRHFSPDEGMQEIVNDIESRIAEILTERLNGRQVVTIEDIREIMRIMGQPAEIDDTAPEAETSAAGETVKGPKRFFRDPEEKVIAGVCSGIAAYFHFDPVWIRLLFILTLLAGGAGVFIYIILWIVMPEALTTTEKLMMRGKRVTISNIEQSVREEFGEIRDRIGKKRPGESGYKAGVPPQPTFFETLFKGTGEILRFGLKILVILIGVMMLLMGISLMLLILLFTFGWSGFPGEVDGAMIMTAPEMARLIFGCSSDIGLLQIIVVLLLGIPVLMLLYNGIRMAFKLDRVRHLSLTLFNIWVVVIIIAAFLGVRNFNLIRSEYRTRTEVVMPAPPGDTLYVAFRSEEAAIRLFDKDIYTLFDEFRVIPDVDSNIAFLPSFWMSDSRDSTWKVYVNRISRGESKSDARKRAERISFPVNMEHDTLYINPAYYIPGEECWRGEEINLQIMVPEGKKVMPLGKVKEFMPGWGYRWVGEIE